MSDSVAQDMIRAFVDRILRLKEEAASIKGDIREVYAEAKGNGFDKTVLGKLVSYVEKRANGATDLAEAEALFDLYLSAYDGASASHTHAREDDDFAGEQHGAARPQRGHTADANTGGKHETAVRSEPHVITNRRHQSESGAHDGRAVETGELQRQPRTVTHNEPAECSAEETSAPHSEPVTIPPVPTVVTEAGDRDRADSSPAAVPVVASNVTAFRTHNPETHFLNSKGLMRLHGCLNAEVCAGSRSKLCFICSVQHEGPAHQETGAA